MLPKYYNITGYKIVLLLTIAIASYIVHTNNENMPELNKIQ